MEIIDTILNIREKHDKLDFPSFHIITPPIEIKTINELENNLGYKLPNEYVDLIIQIGFGTLEGKESNISFFSTEEICSEKLNISGILNNAFVFGSDIGGNYYFFDVYNNSQLGEFSIFLVYPGNPNWEDCIYLGSQLNDILSKIIKGEDFLNLKRGI